MILTKIKKIIYIFLPNFLCILKKIWFLFTKNVHKIFYFFTANVQIYRFKKRYLYNNKNLEKTNSNKNLIISDIQEALGDQIIALDLISRISKNLKPKEFFDIIASKKFKNFINGKLGLLNLNFIYPNYSLGAHIDIYSGKIKYKNIMKIAKEFEKLEYNNVLILTRLVPIDCAILLSSIKCNKIYKFYDDHNISTKNNSVFNEVPFKKLSHNIFERLKEKIEIKDINSKQHFLFNSINVFNSIWSNEKISYKKPYELINILNSKNDNNQIKLFFCLNRISSKIMNFKILEKTFYLLSKKYNIVFNIVTYKSSNKIKKIYKLLNKKMLNFNLYNKLEIENLISLMNESDFILCHDSWDYHMANMLKKKKLLLLNKNDWIVTHSFDYWLNYRLKENILIFDKKYFNSDKKVFYDENIAIKIYEEVEKIL